MSKITPKPVGTAPLATEGAFSPVLPAPTHLPTLNSAVFKPSLVMLVTPAFSRLRQGVIQPGLQGETLSGKTKGSNDRNLT